MRNLTEVSLKNRVLVWYFIIVTAVGGVFAYFELGRMEDPTYTIREMVVTAAWPGASAEEMQEQVTDKLERKIQDVPGLKEVRSETRAGTTTIYAALNDDVAKSDIRPTWRDLRNFCEDVRSQGELPDGVYGPYYNDRFDDVYGTIYALTGDGYSYEEKRAYAEKIRRLLLSLKSVQKITLLGVQEEKVYVEVNNAKLAGLGISPTAVQNALAKTNSMTPAGMVDTDSDNVYLRVTGEFQDLDEIKSLPVNAGGKIFRLGDIATVERRFVEPETAQMYFNGEPAIGIAVSMKDGENILTLGEELAASMEENSADLPAGLELHQVANQSAVVEDSIHDFTKTLFEAIVIVLAVSFFSLGLRTGLVVALSIPLVLAATFVGMYILGIDLQKVSLGALIIALGLLVDDAIIAVEMMSVQLERGKSRFDAACYAFLATAKPMLTGTLITCAGFIPVAFSKGMASEFCKALFPVVTLALGLSWIVSVMVAPLFGTYLIKTKGEPDGDPYKSRFYTLFRRVLDAFLTHRKIVLAATAALFCLSLFMMKFIKQEFFPGSLRPELLVEVKLPQGASLEATKGEMARLAAFLDEQEGIESYSYYAGQYAPRFVLTVSPSPSEDNGGEFVIVAKSTEEREKLTATLTEELNDNYPLLRANIQTIQTGPPADYPLMVRVTGRDVAETKALAEKAAQILREDSNVYNLHMDWGEKSKTMHLDLDQDKLRSMGLATEDVASMLYTELTGATCARFRTGDRTIDIDLRLAKADRENLGQMENLPIYLGSAGYVTLSQIAKISYEGEESLIKRMNTRPSIIVEGNIYSGTANDATTKALTALAPLQEELPLGAKIEAEGALADSQDSMGYLIAPIPAMVFIIMTLLMLQLRSAGKMALTVLTAPLGLIGVSFGMLLTDSALGFVAYLGILALFGMIIRNSVILIDQIEKHIEAGEDPYHALIDSAVLRFRPIMLTAAAAILGMLPLMASSFWCPMAVAIASGLLVATILTLLILPTMYAVAYKVKKTK